VSGKGNLRHAEAGPGEHNLVEGLGFRS
jgi:hypothetical protein